MMTFKILTYSVWISLLTCLITSCSSSKKVNTRIVNTFPIIEVDPALIPISSYECKFIVKESDTTEVDHIVCSDSVRFVELFSNIVVEKSCIEQNAIGTTWYSVSIGLNGEFENLKVVREVNNCFSSTTAQMESILSKKLILEKEYFDTELLFFHKFRIKNR